MASDDLEAFSLSLYTFLSLLSISSETTSADLEAFTFLYLLSISSETTSADLEAFTFLSLLHISSETTSADPEAFDWSVYTSLPYSLKIASDDDLETFGKSVNNSPCPQSVASEIGADHLVLGKLFHNFHFPLPIAPDYCLSL